MKKTGCFKRFAAFLSVLLMVAAICAGTAIAAVGKYSDEKGYPYDDTKNFSLYIGPIRVYQEGGEEFAKKQEESDELWKAYDDGKGTSVKSVFGVTVRDLNGVLAWILSQDTVAVEISGLPLMPGWRDGALSFMVRERMRQTSASSPQGETWSDWREWEWKGGHADWYTSLETVDLYHGTWEDFVAEKKTTFAKNMEYISDTDKRKYKLEERSVGNKKSIIDVYDSSNPADQPEDYEKDGKKGVDIYWRLNESYYVCMDDTSIPGVCIVARIGSGYFVNGTFIHEINPQQTGRQYDITFSAGNLKELLESKLSEAKASNRSDLAQIVGAVVNVTKTGDWLERRKEGTLPVDAPAGGRTESTDAAVTPGEAVIGVIAGVLAVAAAAGAAGAAGSAGAAVAAGGTADGGKTRDEDDQKKSTYRMTLRKDFNDTIRLGGETVALYASMEEVQPDGQILNRPDMAEKISIFTSCKNLSLEEGGMTDVYKTAYVRAGSLGVDGDETEAVVSFRLGDGENFYQNNVKFRLIGKPSLEFDRPGVTMIRGDGAYYDFEVKCVDFLRPDIRVSTEDIKNESANFGVTSVDKTEDPYRFIVHIRNYSNAEDNEGRPPKVCGRLKITASGQNEEAVLEMPVSLVNEGIFIMAAERSYDRDGVLRVLCFADDFKSKDDNLVMERTDFNIKVAVPETEAAGSRKARILEPGEYTVNFGPCEESSEETRVLLSRYGLPLETVYADTHGYKIQPETALPVEKGGLSYNIFLPIEAECQGGRYGLRLPLRLEGLKESPMAGWDEEYERFKRLVRQFGVSGDLSRRIQFNNENRSTEELYLINQMILIDSRHYYTMEGMFYKKIADRMDRFVVALEMMKFLGDQAFSILMTFKFGNWEPVISIAKDLLTQFVGEAWADYNFEETSKRDYDFMGKFRDVVNGAIGDAIKESLAKGKAYNPKKAIALAGTLLTIHVLSHYAAQEKGKKDWLVAVEDGFKSMTAFAIKNIMGQMFGKFEEWLSNDPGVVATFGRYVHDVLAPVFPPDMWQIVVNDEGKFEDRLLSKTDVLSEMVSNYLKDWAGDGAKAVLESIAERSEDITETAFALAGGCLQFQYTVMSPPDPFNPDTTALKQYVGAVYNISIDIAACAAKLGEILYDCTIGQLGLQEPPATLELPSKYQP